MPEPSHPSLVEALASARPNAASGHEKVVEMELFQLKVGADTFAVEAGLIQEVVRAPPITPLPGAPAFLVGVAAHRGDVLAVVDLARLLGRGQTVVSDRSRMAIARADGMVVALLADDVVGLACIPASTLKPPPLGTEDAEFIKGVALEPNPLSLLDLRRALATARERASSRR